MKNTTLCYLSRADGAVLMLYRNKKKNDENLKTAAEYFLEESDIGE